MKVGMLLVSFMFRKTKVAADSQIASGLLIGGIVGTGSGICNE